MRPQGHTFHVSMVRTVVSTFNSDTSAPPSVPLALAASVHPTAGFPARSCPLPDAKTHPCFLECTLRLSCHPQTFCHPESLEHRPCSGSLCLLYPPQLCLKTHDAVSTLTEKLGALSLNLGRGWWFGCQASQAIETSAPGLGAP